MLYGYDVTSLTYICGCTGSQYHSSNDTISMLGIEHLVAKKLRDKIHEQFVEHSIACADKLMKSRRMLERSIYIYLYLFIDKIGKGLGLTPHRSLDEVTPH